MVSKLQPKNRFREKLERYSILCSSVWLLGNVLDSGIPKILMQMVKVSF